MAAGVTHESFHVRVGELERTSSSLLLGGFVVVAVAVLLLLLDSSSAGLEVLCSENRAIEQCVIMYICQVQAVRDTISSLQVSSQLVLTSLKQLGNIVRRRDLDIGPFDDELWLSAHASSQHEGQVRCSGVIVPLISTILLILRSSYHPTPLYHSNSTPQLKPALTIIKPLRSPPPLPQLIPKHHLPPISRIDPFSPSSGPPQRRHARILPPARQPPQHKHTLIALQGIEILLQLVTRHGLPQLLVWNSPRGLGVRPDVTPDIGLVLQDDFGLVSVYPVCFVEGHALLFLQEVEDGRGVYARVSVFDVVVEIFIASRHLALRSEDSGSTDFEIIPQVYDYRSRVSKRRDGH